MKKIVLAENEPGVRIDSYIAERAELSRSYAAKLCADGLVRQNDVPCGKTRKPQRAE